jgi:hypothetical protein
VVCRRELIDIALIELPAEHIEDGRQTPTDSHDERGSEARNNDSAAPPIAFMGWTSRRSRDTTATREA